MNNSLKEEIEKFDIKNFKENFLPGELFHGILIDQKEINKINTTEKTILFKFYYIQNKLYFCLYDYKNIFYNIIDDKEILAKNKDLNSSVEFQNILSLINFLKENLILQNKNLILFYKEKKTETDNNHNNHKISYEITLNSMINKLLIKWVFNCEKVPENFIENLSQNLFINPVHNCLLGLGNLINDPNNIIQNSSTGFNTGISIKDALMMIKCNYLGKKIGFSSSIIDLLNNSSKVVNGYKCKLEESTTDDDEKIVKKASNQFNKKKNKLFPIKKRKQNIFTYCEEKEEEEHITKTESSDIFINDKINKNDDKMDKMCEECVNDGKKSKEKEKKKKKMKFI